MDRSGLDQARCPNGRRGLKGEVVGYSIRYRTGMDRVEGIGIVASANTRAPEGGERRTALVTGGSSGIGKATAKALLKAGYEVVICSRDETKLRRALEELTPFGRCLSQICDVGRSAEAASAVEMAVGHFGGLDALVNSHGTVGRLAPLQHLNDLDWEQAIDSNVRGVFNTIRFAAPWLGRRQGSVVNISSVNAFQSERDIALYAVSKAGILAITRSAACDLAASGVRVNAIAPGWVVTPMTEGIFRRLGIAGEKIETNMLGRPAEPEEIARVALFLAGPGSSFVTGETVIVDGGQLSLCAPLRPVPAPGVASGLVGSGRRRGRHQSGRGERPEEGVP